MFEYTTKKNISSGLAGDIFSKKKKINFCIEYSTCLLCDTTPEIVVTKGDVRKLTPLEYSRLQGFPDDYLDGCERSHSQEYKMWGNGITLQIAEYILGGLAK